MSIIAVPNGRFFANCYLVTDGGASVIVDPGEDTSLISARLAETGTTPEAIWLTHAHIDHVLGVTTLKRATGVPVYLHPADGPLYEHIAAQAQAFGMRADPLPPPDRTLAHGDILRVGRLTFDVRHVPGHSPGSVCFVGAGMVLAGDVLFRESIGRTDLFGGDMETLLAGIERELLSLADETIVYSGHGPQTTIGHERRHNPFLTRAARPL
ncbi:MAG TPA: MBL fold metallo-hydrolase [Gemmatimonadales bacterium]|nr:MBL fold metallo-hydrolase [Gemmatimonadales bacterium]